MNKRKIIQNIINVIRTASIALFSIAGMVCLFKIKYVIGFWIAFALLIALTVMTYMPTKAVSNWIYCVIMFGLLFYALVIELAMQPNFKYRTRWDILVIFGIIAAFLSFKDIRAIVCKTEAQKRTTMQNLFTCFGIFLVLLMFYRAASIYRLPFKSDATKVMVTRQYKEATHATKGPKYKYYIKYVELEGDRERDECEVSQAVYKRVTPIFGRLYVIKSRNLFGDTVSIVSFNTNPLRIQPKDIGLGILSVLCFASSMIIYYLYYRKECKKG